MKLLNNQEKIMNKLTRRIKAFFLKRKMEWSINKLENTVRQFKLDIITEHVRRSLELKS